MRADDLHQHEGHGNHEHPGMEEDVELSARARRLLAMEELLVEKGVIDRDDVRRLIEVIEARSPVDGARVVARAWVDAAYKRRLLKDPRVALAELGYPLVSGAKLVVVENTEKVHHLVVCTLCSCYPTSLLGLRPTGTRASRIGRGPSSTLAGSCREFGLEVGKDVEIRVVDSAADLRYMVLPLRPRGTERMGEQDLVALVTRDSLVGVGVPNQPVVNP